MQKHVQHHKAKKAALKAERDADWNYTLCMFCERDCSIAMFGCLCFPCASSSQASELTEGKVSTTTFLLCPCLCVPCCRSRTLFRNYRNIKGNQCADYCIGCFCGPCSVCQIANELDREKQSNKRNRNGPKPQEMDKV